MAEAKSPSPARAAIDLFLISLLSLYFELFVIRWLSSEIRIFAYFKNLPLMACLFGLGLGLALAKSKWNLARWFPLGLLAVTLLICFAAPLGLIHIIFVDPVEHYLLGLADTPFVSLQLIHGLALLVSIFYLIVFVFVCMGQKLGQLFESFRPLVAYSINVGASLLGIILFSVISFLQWKPEGWLLLGVLLSLWLFRGPLQITLMACAVATAFATVPPHVVWSPYYRISIQEWWLPPDAGHPAFKYGTNISVNHDFLEGAFDNRPESLARLSPRQRAETWEHYSTLYRIIGDGPRDVLILASGMGNDVAAALRHGAAHVDAVEIDPVVVESGRQYHVERPYSNPRVSAHVNDARAFLRQTTKKYDLVDFAYLDSHAAFSSMSSVRLDNYVYTVESFKDALKLLKPDGILAVHFFATKTWQTTRIIKTLEKALGYEPVGVWSETGRALILLAGPGVDRERIAASGYKLFRQAELRKANLKEHVDYDSIEPTTDDWPFLFLRHRELTFTYAIGLFVTLLTGIGLVAACFGRFSTSAMGRTMFFLGAGFMLVEVKSVTQMGLLLGTTWLVNSAVIGAILLMILVANTLMLRYRFQRVTLLYGLLMLSLAVSYLIPLSLFQSLPFLPRTILGAINLSIPLVFAALIFAITFSKVDKPSTALGMNLLGALVGGALEYASMILGVNALNLVAILLYAGAWLSWKGYALPEAAEEPAIASAPEAAG